MPKKTKNCIVCDKKIESLYGSSDMWDSAIVDRIEGGFGSSYDTDTIIIAICDSCITKNKDKIEFI